MSCIENKYTAGIVTYNPEIQRLKQNMDAVSQQVHTLYIYDNASSNVEEITKLANNYENVEILYSDKNMGVAGALNAISERAAATGAKWLLTLDHDSVIPSGFICECAKYIADDVGIICPVMIDKRRPQYANAKKEESISEIDFCITSGSFVNLEVWEKIGKYDDFLFVGLVDNEYCMRTRLQGKRIIRLNNMLMDHELGTLQPSKFAPIFTKVGNVTGNKKILALSYKRKVSPFRVYYATRNIVYLSHKYKNYPCYEFSIKYAVKNGMSNFLRSGCRLNVLNSLVRGFRDGYTAAVTPLMRI